MKKIREEKGSMAVYVSVVLLSMLFILMAVFFTSNAIRKSQLETVFGIKKAYESDNQRASEIYDSITGNDSGSGGDNTPTYNYVYEEEFETTPSYGTVNTTYSANNGVLSLTSTGGDPQVKMYYVTSFNPSQYRYIDVRYRTSSNVDTMEFFMIEDPSNQTYSVSGKLITDGQWHILTIDLWSNENVKNRTQITGWRWDWSNANGDNQKMEVDYIKIR